MSSVEPTITLYRGESRGHRHGFKVVTAGRTVHESGLIYNDEIHANVAVAKFMGFKDKSGKPVRGSRISLTKNFELGRRAQRFLRGGGAEISAAAASMYV